MSDCCSTEALKSSKPNKYTCPVNGKLYTKVSKDTIFHHIKKPWDWSPDAQSYYFCDDPDCEVVYFGDDDSTISKEQLRTQIGVKEKQNDSALICYCFGVSKKEAQASKEVKAFVMSKTKEKICACDTRNPSGRCCLKDFP